MNWMMISQIGLWIVMLAMCAVLFLFMRMVGQFLYRFQLAGGRLEEQRVKVGDRAPLFRAKDQNNQLIRLSDSNQGLTLLVFASNSCQVCHEVILKIPSLIQSYNVRVVLISKDAFEMNGIGNSMNIHSLKSEEIFDNYFVDKVPFLVLVRQDNTIEGVFRSHNIDTLPEVLKYSARGSKRVL